MTIPFSQSTLVKDIVNDFPKASDLYKRNRIDFCCGGNKPLIEAAMGSRVEIGPLMEALT